MFDSSHICRTGMGPMNQIKPYHLHPVLLAYQMYLLQGMITMLLCPLAGSFMADVLWG